MAVTAAFGLQRKRRGASNIAKILAPASTSIPLGTMLWDNSDVAALASTFTWSSNLAGTQPGFKKKFLGIATGARIAADTTADQFITYDTSGVFEMDCVAASGFTKGVFVGPAKDAAGNNLLDSTVAVVATYDLAIGTVADTVGSSATKVNVEIFGQVNALAPSTLR